MYAASHFAEQRIDVLQAFIGERPFGALVVSTPGGLVASHVPFVFDPAPAPYGTLRCHVARANPIWREFDASVPALAIFQDIDAYISPSAYATKRETGKVVPTYNYVAVHATGRMRAIDDREWLRALVEKLTASFESKRVDPWHVSDAPADYIDAMLSAIVGLEIALESLAGSVKASQNRPAADRDGVVRALRVEGGENALAMASLVEARSAAKR